MKKLYVVGNNTSKSLSPLIFNYWFSKYNLKAKYEYIEVDHKNFHKEVSAVLNDKKTIGLNITIPYKKKIMKYVGSFDKHSTKIKAVNFVINKGSRKGFNTDWIGYYNSIRRLTNLKKRKILLLGYGGASQSIHYTLKQAKPKELTIYNRTKRKILFEKKTKFTKTTNLDKYLPTADLIINTTPTNLIKKHMVKLVKPNAIISEIVYSPKITKFLRQFPNHKKNYGIDMLLEQAIPCFEKLFDFKPVVDQKLIKLLNDKVKK